MKKIPLTQGQVALVDDEDYEWLNQWKWYAVKGTSTYYAKRKLSVHEINALTIIPMQNALLAPPKGCEVDHKDLNGLNNTRANLRIATRSQNAINRLTARNIDEFPYKGVYKIKCGWMAKIGYHDQIIYLGSFRTPTDAAIAYDSKARELFGEFARLNMPDK